MKSKNNIFKYLMVCVLAIGMAGCGAKVEKDDAQDRKEDMIEDTYDDKNDVNPGVTTTGSVYDVLKNLGDTKKATVAFTATDTDDVATLTLGDGKSTISCARNKTSKAEVLTYFNSLDSSTTTISANELTLSYSTNNSKDTCAAGQRCSINVSNAVDRTSEVFDDFNIDIEDNGFFRGFEFMNDDID